MKKLLIANRGEIALRIIRTAKRLGIATVSVYSEADAQSPHVAAADEDYLLGEAAANESYLNIPKLIAACKQTGADAVHPGYGFLSESPEFAEAVIGAGLCFVGPTPATMRVLGHKDSARAAAASIGIPVLPGYQGEIQDDAALELHSKALGMPLLIKAAAGGGGKGMRLVTEQGQFTDALQSARREAQAFFGNSRMMLEKRLDHVRHIEVQVLGDGLGKALHIFERDCSLQRRYQKVIEESPAADLPPPLAERIRSDAVRLASHSKLTGVATIEFLVTQDQSAYYFLEANPRLQVEHPVTEMCTGLDLVELQLRLAAGEPLLLAQNQITRHGVAIEARIYAEDPWHGFLPRTGTLTRLSLPSHSSFGVGEVPLRIDHFLSESAAISSQYDPLLAKAIAWGETRESALARLRHCLQDIRLDGVQTNIPFLIELIGIVLSQNLVPDTNFIDAYLASDLPMRHLERLATTAACLFAVHEPTVEQVCVGTASDHDQYNPFFRELGWRGHGAAQQSSMVNYCVSIPGDEAKMQYEIAYCDNKNRSGPRGVSLFCNGQVHRLAVSENIAADGRKILEFDGYRLAPVFEVAYLTPAQRVCARILLEGQWLQVLAEGAVTAIPDSSATNSDTIVSPLPGRVLSVTTAVGSTVVHGETLIIVESMKMEHRISATGNGTVKEILCQEGSTVNAGDVLLRLE